MTPEGGAGKVTCGYLVSANVGARERRRRGGRPMTDLHTCPSCSAPLSPFDVLCPRCGDPV